MTPHSELKALVRALTALERATRFDDSFAGRGEGPGQGCPERPGALDANRLEVAMASHPGQERLVAGVVGEELSMGVHKPSLAGIRD